MPDRYGRMTGADWMGYANSLFGLAGSFQKNKIAQSAIEAQNVEDVGSLYGQTTEAGNGTTEFGPGIKQAMGGALESVQANPALNAKANLAGLKYRADQQQALAQEVVAKNALMDDFAGKLAAQYQPDFDTQISMSPESPDMALDGIYRKMKEVPGAENFDSAKLRSMVGNKMLEQYLASDSAQLQLKQNANTKTALTVQAIQQKADSWGQKAIAYNQTNDPMMQKAIGKSVVNEVFGTLFDSMYGAAFDAIPTENGVEIIEKTGNNANRVYKTIDYTNPQDVNDILNAAIGLASNPQSSQVINQRIKDSQMSKLSLMLDRKPGTTMKPTTLYDKNGQEHKVNINDHLYLSKDGSMLSNSMGTKLFPMGDTRNVEAMSKIEFFNELDSSTEKALVRQYQQDVESLGEEAALMNYDAARSMALRNKKTQDGKILDQEYLDNYITLLKKAGSNEQMAAMMNSLDKVYSGIGIPSYTLADGTKSPEGIGIRQYIALQGKAIQVEAENRKLDEQAKSGMQMSAHAPTQAIMQGTPAQVQPGASTFQGALQAEPNKMMMGPSLPRTGTQGALREPPMQGMNIIEAARASAPIARDLLNKAGDTAKEMGLTNLSTQNKITKASESSNLGVQSKLWGKEYQGMSSPAKMKKFESNVKKYRENPPVNSAAAYDAVDVAMNVFSGEIEKEGLDAQGIDNLGEFMYNIALHESDGLKYTKQKKGGPARGWWQVEPKSARDWLQSSGMYGPKAEQAVGYTKRELMSMSNKEFNKLLEDPTVSAIFGTGIFLQHN